MKIIFDSEEQKTTLLYELSKFPICPLALNLPEFNDCYGVKCYECWEQAIECEIKGPCETCVECNMYKPSVN